MKKLLLSGMLALTTAFASQAQNVYIPDANFKNALLGMGAINSNGDGEIQYSEAAAWSGMIIVPNLGITDLTGIEAFTRISYLEVQNNSLTSLNLSQNTALTTLIVNNNSLTSLNVSANTAIATLNAAYNNISSLDLGPNTALTTLIVNNNSLTSLNVSANTALATLNVANNSLLSLNVANGNNAGITSFYALGNSSLNCIQVDNAAFSTNNWTDWRFSFGSGIHFLEDCNCTVTIPDANFKNALLNHNPVIDINNDGEIQCAEAFVFTGQMTIRENIGDLTGIEAFTNLMNLFLLGVNSFSHLDLSQNTALKRFDVDSGSLTALDLGQNTVLTMLKIINNPLLTSLDISANTALTQLIVNNNGLTSLDISANTALTHLHVNNNGLTSLDVSANRELVSLEVYHNSLTWLNLANGRNDIFYIVGASFNPDLACIQVDRPGAAMWRGQAQEGWFEFDDGVSFSRTCTPTSFPSCNVIIPDVNLISYLLGNYTINIDRDNHISCSEAAAVTGTLYLDGLDIADLTGIEHFINLTELSVSWNALTSLDLSQNTALTKLNVGSNSLSSLDLSANTALTELVAGSNSLSTLDLSNNMALTVLHVGNNDFETLDLSQYSALRYVQVQDNKLRSLDIQNGNNARIMSIWAHNNPELICIQVDDAAYSAANWTSVDFAFGTGVGFNENCSPVTGLSGVHQNIVKSVYPNPANAMLTIEVNENTEIRMVNMLGTTVRTQKLSAGSNNVDVSDLAKGVYFLYPSTNSGYSEAMKFVKE